MVGDGRETAAPAAQVANDHANGTHERHWHEIPSAAYLLPNDSPEHERLNAQAVHLSNMLKQRLIHAPVDTSTATNLLDVGCGTGIVTRYMSHRYPQANCYGLDLSPVPSVGAPQPTVKFLLGDVVTQPATQWKPERGQNNPFTRETNLFDLVFSRLLIFGISNWQLYANRAFVLCKPGGYVEFQDLRADYLDCATGEDLSRNWAWHKAFVQNYASRGLDVHCGANAKEYLTNAGFVDIQTTEYQYPIGSRAQKTQEARDFAAFNEVQLPQLFGLTLERMFEGKMQRAEIDEEVRQLRATFDPDRAVYMPYIITVARKPV